MLIEIKHRFTGVVMFSHDVDGNTVKTTLVDATSQGADLRGANLQGADLRGADLQGADLRGVDLQGADLQGADLRGADLQGVYLRGADLRGANLRGANEDALEKNPIYINELYWLVTITTKHLTIGCQHHSHEAWANFTQQEIENMESHAQEFWSVWKTPLLAMCEAHKK